MKESESLLINYVILKTIYSFKFLQKEVDWQNVKSYAIAVSISVKTEVADLGEIMADLRDFFGYEC